MQNIILTGLLLSSLIGAGAVGTTMMADDMGFMNGGHMGMMGENEGHMMDEMHEHHGECEEMQEECEEYMDEECDEISYEECLELHEGDYKNMSEFCDHDDHEHEDDEHGCAMMH